jgi:3-hydroxyacyl-CoA dehydrogenase/enoyl-CoA hydratase/carnithine racemase
MTQGSPTAPATAERVTHAQAHDVALPTGTLALITLDNGFDRSKPATLGPRGLTELRDVLVTVRDRAGRGEVVAVAVTGAPPHFVAGADLRVVAGITDPGVARAVAELGHAAFRLLGEMGVPTFAFVNGAALGGGLELALHCTYRTVAADVTALALPETHLGLVPGWGGCALLPHLVGIETALELVLRRPALSRTTAAAEALGLGLVDVVLEPDGFVERSVAWAGEVLRGAVTVPRRPPDGDQVWVDAVGRARTELDRRLHGAAPAPYRALDLLDAARAADRDTAFRAEDDALTELLVSDELRAGVYAFDVTSRARRSGPQEPGAARAVRKVGVIGAGLMATQLAVLVAHRLGVPVAMREVDDERATAGLASVRAQVESMVRGGRLGDADGERLVSLVTVGTDLAALADADLVIEAVTEVMAVKQRVFADVEALVAPEAVLATNTSALSVTTMGRDLRHPGRVVGLHFFNPVARMPLVEVVHTSASDDISLATAFDVAVRLGKTAVAVADRPGFVVNRVLLRLLADVAATVERGTPVEVADRALRPLGLPMGPFALIQLVGLPVALHVLGTLHDELGDRYPLSPGLARLAEESRPLVRVAADGGEEVDPAIQDAFGGSDPLDEAGVLDAVLVGLTEEISLLLEEGVVTGPRQVDLCMILGAGWPFHLGGITPYLDSSGLAERVLGHRFHTKDGQVA